VTSEILDRAKINNILIRAVNWLGDAVMTIPAIGAVRASFPCARITLLANPLVAELFTPHEWIDEVVVYHRKGSHAGLRGKLAIAKELKKRRFDLAILLQNAFDAAFLAWLARIPCRMGYPTDCRGLLLTHVSRMAAETGRLHQVEYYLAMLKEQGITTGDRRLLLTATPEEERAVAEMLAGVGVGVGDFLIGINPGATYGTAKRWYPERFAQVANELSCRWGARVVITGGPTEADIAGEIEAAMSGACLNMAGHTSVRILMALIKRCDFFITNDSGPMHIAAAFGVPLVAIFGPTDHTTTSPFSNRAVVVRQDTECAPCLKRECPTDQRCMATVTAAVVVEEAIQLRQRLEHRRDA
jgi:heptosyltransferase-2